MNQKLIMNDEQLQHFLRNPHGTSVEHQREIRLQAADRIDALTRINRDAYTNIGGHERRIEECAPAHDDARRYRWLVANNCFQLVNDYLGRHKELLVGGFTRRVPANVQTAEEAIDAFIRIDAAAQA